MVGIEPAGVRKKPYACRANDLILEATDRCWAIEGSAIGAEAYEGEDVGSESPDLPAQDLGPRHELSLREVICRRSRPADQVGDS